MANYGFLCTPLYVLTTILLLQITLLCRATTDDDDERKVYIVYMGSIPEEEYSLSSHHSKLLQEIVEGSSVENTLVRTYQRSFNGFAAKLTMDEARKLASREEVVSIFPSTTIHLQTTRSWDFMGFSESTTVRNSIALNDTVIGVLDSGLWPESESFQDKGFGPPPKKWKGECNGGLNFTCNNKVIGARYYSAASKTARDIESGHGTHTSSIVAGNVVKGASFYGLAEGTARGGVPSARIATYKVCAPICKSTDILAGFDDAIADGVDIITISLATQRAFDYSIDAIAIGAFHAMEKGVLTVQSAGNDGPGKASVAAVAPWIVSVAASTTDRLFIDKVVLGNGKMLTGSSVNSFNLNGTKYPLVYGLNTTRDCINESSVMCYGDCLDIVKVRGKIIVCESIEGVYSASEVGAYGSINLNELDDPLVVPVPSLSLTSNNFGVVRKYVTSTENPVAEVLKSQAIKNSAAPEIGWFSARGPNRISLDILKPDITAPGVNILAAFPPVRTPSGLKHDRRRANYAIQTGTSMSSPHVAAVAAYVKASHPDWSPSAIRSAIMTTAWPMNASAHPDAEFSYGSGHLNPVKASHPGLVYETFKPDYIKFLCSIGFGAKKVRLVAGDNSTCPTDPDRIKPKDLNYPSMSVNVSPNMSFSIGFHRTVTNVGFANSTYEAKVSTNSRFIRIKVAPQILTFKSLNEKQSFNVTVASRGLPDDSVASASLVWSDGSHNVRSPIVVHTVLPLDDDYDV